MKGLVITLLLLTFPFLVGIHSAHAKETFGCCIESLNKIVQPISETVTDTLKPVTDAAGDLTDKVVQPVSDAVTGTLKPVTDAAGDLTDKVVQPVAETLTDTLNPVTNTVGELTDKVVQPVAETLIDTLNPVTDTVGDLTDKVVQPVAETLTDILNPVTDTVGELTDKVVRPVADTLTDTLKPIADAVGELANEVVQPVAETVTNSQMPFEQDVSVQPVLYLDISPAENHSAEKSSTPKDRPLDILPSTTLVLPVANRLDTAGGAYTAAILTIPKPAPLLSKEKGQQATIVNSSNTIIIAKTSQFPEREPFPTIPLSEPALPPSPSTVGSLLPLAASAKNGNAKSLYAGSDFKAVLIDKAEPMIPCSRMSWHRRIRHYLSWSHAPPLRPPVAPALDN